VRLRYQRRLGKSGKVLVAVGGALLFLVVASSMALSTEEYMQRLPSYSTYACGNCHASNPPSSLDDYALNGFGEDFKSNGFAWDDSLAARNSDGDRCTNGFELGDEDGDGFVDEGTSSHENSNPGVVDCEVALTPKTWGLIKSIFKND
jgi:hypothetical protein